MILVIDNFDSFVYNLYQYIAEIKGEDNVQVLRSNLVVPAKIIQLNPTALVISPGPGRPEKIPNIVEITKRFAEKIPTLGVCLGHQILGYAFGAKIRHAKKIMHGKASRIKINNEDPIFSELPDTIEGGRYHSLVVDELPDSLEIIARAEDDGEIMAMRHRKYPAYGIQFHPESVLTPQGKKIIENFIKIAEEVEK